MTPHPTGGGLLGSLGNFIARSTVSIGRSIASQTGITNAISCIGNPSWSQCGTALFKGGMNLAAILSDGTSLEAEDAITAITDTSTLTTEGGVTVYRGTSISSELQIHAETGQLMSDAARAGYMESGGSVAAGRAASEAAHAAGIQTWGSEAAYAEAHGAFGTELSQFGPRSMISVTTDPAIAKIFAGPGGRVFSAVVDPSILIPQTLEGAGESEFLIPHMFGAG